jgi:hypothetical protein
VKALGGFFLGKVFVIKFVRSTLIYLGPYENTSPTSFFNIPRARFNDS